MYLPLVSRATAFLTTLVTSAERHQAMGHPVIFATDGRSSSFGKFKGLTDGLDAGLGAGAVDAVPFG